MKSPISRLPNQKMQKASTSPVRTSKGASKPASQAKIKVAMIRDKKSEREISLSIKSQQAVPVAKTIGEEFDEIISTIPDKILESLPTDGAERHDFYLYQAH